MSMSSYGWMLKQVDIMRIFPYLNFMVPVNKRLYFGIPLGPCALLKVVGAVIIHFAREW